MDHFRLFIEDISMLRGPQRHGDTRHLVTNMTVTAMDMNLTVPTEQDSFILKREQAVELMTLLWGYGVRPANYKDNNPGEIAAMKAHIEDLRAVQKAYLEYKPLLTAGKINWEKNP